MASSRFRQGDWVEVRRREEILATLDSTGRLGGLPFMPEMFQYCGRRFRVWRRAHKTCDTVQLTGGRRLLDAVHLENLRCDGSGHGGCQADCLLFWKDAWLRPLRPLEETARRAVRPERQPGCTEDDVLRHATAEAPGNEPSGAEREVTYVCQATLLPDYTTLLSRWDVRQYWEDWRSGNVSLRQMVGPLAFACLDRLANAGIGLGRALRWAYDKVQRRRGGQVYPKYRGRIPAGARTPSVELQLQEGEWVRVRDFEAILETLDTNNKNRGMYFDAEEVPYCGETLQVKRRVSRIIDERTGRMLHFKSSSVILDGAYCQGRYSCRRLFCPRAISPLWREIWLERAPAPEGNVAG
jgi:hypothetical protein